MTEGVYFIHVWIPLLTPLPKTELDFHEILFSLISLLLLFSQNNKIQ